MNGALARRSPGSALKPFLYAAAFSTGRLAPDSLVPDRPIERDGWADWEVELFFAAILAGRCEEAFESRFAARLRGRDVPSPSRRMGKRPQKSSGPAWSRPFQRKA